MSKISSQDYAAAALTHIGWRRFHQDSLRLSRSLKELNHPWAGLVAITRGGLVPAMIVARALDIRKIESLSVASYDGQRQGEPEILKGAEAAMACLGENWLIIDDLTDSGVTARLARNLLPKAYLAAVYAKPAGAPALDMYAEEIDQAVWVVFPWEQEGEE